ncbi:peptidoglycan DD-metalloendopeptidase family protein [Pontibacter sp. SGAir0037]|uniref:peptidoglycan DD-metalloendopeptidase family protein n=1 Tax=Pontibacter sp. SGAir0037 TaxID=2571030 RepID=UPI0010CD16CD|nr:peptidoglycan DD-metalloendopeptidase family protein [Pontibacter sp. SGAir0037]QCR22801.1 peptidase M23 [Pontibacter sp. SGAir0037]
MQKTTIKYLPLINFLVLVLLITGCGGPQALRQVFTKQTPYERYASSLKDAKLDQTALGKAWAEAGEKALQDSLTVTLPFKETGYFAAETPMATSYRFEAKRGQKIVVNLETRSKEEMKVFMDLYKLQPVAKHVSYADTAAVAIEYEIEDDLTHLLRVQPELLRSGQYTISIISQPTLAFPVPSKKNRGIDSFWGDPRDAGTRNHEGVDIVAPRGTPVVASVPGIVTRVGTNKLGGNVVWLSDANRRQNLYYAHLDKQLVTAGQRVNIGDTLGLVGNTGNARGTTPHLHFGIYRSGTGATNPYPYLHMPSQTPPAITADLKNLGGWLRVSTRSANTRLLPSTKSNVYRSLPQHTPLQVIGGTGNWYRVSLPDGTEAYIANSVVESISKPVRYEKLAKETDLLDEAHPLAAPKDSLSSGSSVAVLATFNDFRLVRNEAGETGWIHEDSQLSTR